MTVVDLGPAARRMAELMTEVPDRLLDAPTPCPDTSLGDLLDHIGGLTLAFTAKATKDTADIGAPSPSASATQLVDDWRTRIPPTLLALAEAWRHPDAWEGMTQVGGQDLPAEVAGLVALDELVVHGWDVARASGQAYECDQPSLEAAHRFLEGLSEPGREAIREGRFGPVVEVLEDAPLLDRVIGLSGRDPAWAP